MASCMKGHQNATIFPITFLWVMFTQFSTKWYNIFGCFPYSKRLLFCVSGFKADRAQSMEGNITYFRAPIRIKKYLNKIWWQLGLFAYAADNVNQIWPYHTHAPNNTKGCVVFQSQLCSCLSGIGDFMLFSAVYLVLVRGVSFCFCFTVLSFLAFVV